MMADPDSIATEIYISR